MARVQPLSVRPRLPPHSQCTHTGHTVTVAAVCLVGSRPSSGAPGAEHARALQQALLQGWRAPTVLPTPSSCLSARPHPAPHTHWSLRTGRLLLEGSSAYLEGMPTCPAMCDELNTLDVCVWVTRTHVPAEVGPRGLLPWSLSPWGSYSKRAQWRKAERGVRPRYRRPRVPAPGAASALQMWPDPWPAVGVRDCPPRSRARALSLGLGGDTGWGSGLSPRRGPGCAVHQGPSFLSLPDPGGPGLLVALQPLPVGLVVGNQESYFSVPLCLDQLLLWPQRESKGGSRGLRSLLSASRSVLSVSGPRGLGWPGRLTLI